MMQMFLIILGLKNNLNKKIIRHAWGGNPYFLFAGIPQRNL